MTFDTNLSPWTLKNCPIWSHCGPHASLNRFTFNALKGVFGLVLVPEIQRKRYRNFYGNSSLTSSAATFQLDAMHTRRINLKRDCWQSGRFGRRRTRLWVQSQATYQNHGHLREEDCSLAWPPASADSSSYVTNSSSCCEAHFGALFVASVLICPQIQRQAAGLPTAANDKNPHIQLMVTSNRWQRPLPIIVYFNCL